MAFSIYLFLLFCYLISIQFCFDLEGKPITQFSELSETENMKFPVQRLLGFWRQTVVPYIQYWSLLSMKSCALQIKKPPFPARVKERIHYYCVFWQKHNSFQTKYSLMCRSHWPTMQLFTSVCPQHDYPVMQSIIL